MEISWKLSSSAEKIANLTSMYAYLVRFFTPPRPQGLCEEDNRAVHVVISAQLSAQLQSNPGRGCTHVGSKQADFSCHLPEI
jgi:hypothetical protein